MPFAFTEQGVGMLSGVLNSGKAVQMHVAIVRAFVALKEFALNYKNLAGQIHAIRKTVTSHSEQLNQIYDAIENMLEEKEEKKKSWNERERIGYKKLDLLLTDLYDSFDSFDLFDYSTHHLQLFLNLSHVVNPILN